MQGPPRLIRHENLLELKLSLGGTNVLDRAAFESLHLLLEEARSEDRAGALLLTGSSGGFFSSGLDPLLFLERNESDVREAMSLILSCAETLFFLPFPVFVSLEGHALGAGAVLALCADYRYMTDGRTRIGFPEATIAMSFPSLSARILADLVGVRVSRDLLYSGKLLRSEEALSAGLVDAIHPPGELDRHAREAAVHLASLPGNTGRLMKAAMRRDYLEFADRVRTEDLETAVRTIQTPEAQEGFRSIHERRRPRFGR